MAESTQGHYAPDLLSNQKAGGLLLAFLAAVILVLAVATSLPAPTAGSVSISGATGTLSGSQMASE